MTWYFIVVWPSKLVRPGGYCGTLDDPLPLLPSGPGGVHGVQLHSPPQPDTERVGFEPTVEFPPHTLSKRAPSTTRTSLQTSEPSDSTTNILHLIRTMRTGRGRMSLLIS